MCIRDRQKALPKAGADKCPPYQADICPPEIEIEKEIEKERERELDTGQPARAAYGRYENVFLSQSELDGLKADPVSYTHLDVYKRQLRN